ncbi:MAG: hypothetical protein IH599_02165, partial [Bacteroidales bacterium]|nr:hypothetical protein [Bacteroidales bacterium]
MEEKTSIDLLREFARGTGRTLEYTSVPYPTVAVHPIAHHRITAYVADDARSNLIFSSFSDSREFGALALFSGVFLTVNIPRAASLIARKAHAIDRLAMFSAKDRLKTGVPTFDRKIVLKGNDQEQARQFFGNHRIQDWSLKSLELDERCRIGVNIPDLDFVPAFKGRSVAGLFILGGWLLEPERIERFYEQVR